MTVEITPFVEMVPGWSKHYPKLTKTLKKLVCNYLRLKARFGREGLVEEESRQKKTIIETQKNQNFKSFWASPSGEDGTVAETGAKRH